VRVFFVASEALPYAKTGGLGDVTGSLASALHRLGADVRLVLPFYGAIKARNLATEQVMTSTLMMGDTGRYPSRSCAITRHSSSSRTSSSCAMASMLRASSLVHVELSPIRTVSNSEGGVETIYQGMTLLLALDLGTSRLPTLEIGG
jgi:hypothetical protein